MTYILSEFSEAIAALAAGAAPWLAAIRIGPNQHVTGIAWGPDLVVTTEQALPPRDTYTLVLSSGMLAEARGLHRDPSLNLALLRLEHPNVVPGMTVAARPGVGALVVALGADYDGTPTVRLTAVHRQAREADQGAVLDLAEARTEVGGLVIDPSGGVLGMTSVARDGAVTVVPHRVITQFVEGAPLSGSAPMPATTGVRPVPEPPRPVYPPPRPAAMPAANPPRMPIPARPAARSYAPTTGRNSERKAWLGVALQPIAVPEPLIARAGQNSGRLVVSLTAGGPAEQAGLRVGDVVLSLDGHSTSGPNSLRSFLDGSRIGNQVEVRVLRETALATAYLTVAEAP